MLKEIKKTKQMLRQTCEVQTTKNGEILLKMENLLEIDKYNSVVVNYAEKGTTNNGDGYVYVASKEGSGKLIISSLYQQLNRKDVKYKIQGLTGDEKGYYNPKN